MYRWRIKRYCGIILTFLENWIGRFLIVFFDFWQIYLKESVLASWCPNTNSYISLSPFNSNLVFMESNWSGCIGIPTRSNTQILRMASRDFILSILVSATTKQWPTRWTWVWFNQKVRFAILEASKVIERRFWRHPVFIKHSKIVVSNKVVEGGGNWWSYNWVIILTDCGVINTF